MRISDIYRTGDPVFSFEFFPPKTDKGAEDLMATCADLKAAVRPDFVSVTYGAGGSTRDRTHQIVTRIQSELGIPTMAHQTCVAASRADIASCLSDLESNGIQNILALRGDPPKGEEEFVAPADGFAHATDLIEYAAANHDLAIGGAFYPEAHPESASMEEDLEWTKKKVDLGASFLISQLFFDNRHYFEFAERAKSKGVDCALVPGIMPVTNVAQIERFTKMCGRRFQPSSSSACSATRTIPRS